MFWETRKTRTSRKWHRRIAVVAAAAVLQALLGLQLPAQAAALSSVGAGDWSSPSTWNLNRVPAAGDTVTVRHAVRLNADATVAGVTIAPAGTLTWRGSGTRTLTSTGNVVVHGTLRMRPATPAQNFRLVFAGVNEAAFQGGGMDPLATDVGLWVRAGATMDTVGSDKTSWTRATGTVPAGATRFTVGSAQGWRVGDEVAFGPTQPEERRNAFETMTITAVDQTTGAVTVDRATSRAHVRVNLPDGRVLNPEVLNLTRNVNIEGTPSGRTHIHVHGAGPQTIRNVGLRYMGVPVETDSNVSGGATTSGRYALHFHHSGDASRGTLVEGVVARDVGTHAFVPHTSHGITFRSTIAYGFEDAAYWWDRMDGESVALTDDTVYEDCVAANGRQYGILQAFGLRNVMRSCVVYGIDLTSVGAPGRGFAWEHEPTHAPGFTTAHTIWEWSDGIAHNVGNPIWTWQIDPEPHNIVRPIAYWPTQVGSVRHAALLHGAYMNNYHFIDGIMMGNIAFELHAASGNENGRIQEHRNMIYDAAGGAYAIRVTAHELPSEAAGLISNCRILNYTDSAVRVFENTTNRFSRGADFTFLNCTTDDGSPLMPEDFDIVDLHPNSELCIQNGSDAWMIDGGPGSVYTVSRVPVCPSVSSTSPSPEPSPSPTPTPEPSPSPSPSPSPTAPSGDTTEPHVHIFNPANGATVSGRIPFRADASDNVGVVRVEFYIDGRLVETDTDPAYGYAWDTTTTYNGTHNLHVIAYDAAGNRDGFRVTVTVRN